MNIESWILRVRKNNIRENVESDVNDMVCRDIHQVLRYFDASKTQFPLITFPSSDQTSYTLTLKKSWPNGKRCAFTMMEKGMLLDGAQTCLQNFKRNLANDYNGIDVGFRNPFTNSITVCVPDSSRIDDILGDAVSETKKLVESRVK